MDLTLAGSRTAQQEDWLNDALAGLLYDYEHPALPCSVTVRWDTQAALQELGDHGVGTYFAFTQVSESTLSATIRIWDELDTQTGRFSGQDFYMETVAHELGHVVAGVRSNQRASFQSEFTSMVSGAGTWTGGDWEERLLEAFAEIFKDVFLPGRKFDNRTTHKLNRGSFSAYLVLVNAAEGSTSVQPHIDYDLSPGGEHGRGIGLWGSPFVSNVGYPFFWGVGGEPGNPTDWQDGITGGIFTPPDDDRSGLSTFVLDYDLTMATSFDLPYAANDDVGNPPGDPAYNADIDPTNWEYVGWDNGLWNADFGVGADPSGYNLARGRRILNTLFGHQLPIESHAGGTLANDANRGGPLFFLRWEAVDALAVFSPEELAAVQEALDAQYSHLEQLVGQAPQYSGALSTPPDLTTLGFSADCPVRLRIGTQAIAQITELVGALETTVNGGTIGDVRPAGPGVTEEWMSRDFTVIFSYRFADVPWPYPTSVTWVTPNGPKTRKVQYAGNGWNNRRGTTRRFVGVPSPTVNFDE